MKLRPVHAPRLPDDLQWVDGAVTTAELQGRVTVFDFWTLCCVNCMHNTVELRRLAKRFGERLQIVGIHSPKFPYEHRIEAVRAAVDRMGITWPVLNDPDHVVREEWAVKAWPTTVIVDGRGRIAETITGECSADRLASLIEPLEQELSLAPLAAEPPLESEQSPAPDSLLRYPGGVAVAGDRLWISDTGHDRILELELTVAEHGTFGTVTRAWGRRGGFADGDAATAAFRSPRGLHVARGQLFVADSGNHAVRSIDLESGGVSTIAGTGELSRTHIEAGPATGTHLRSPWDVASINEITLVSMAGSHQIWMIADGQIGRFAGSGSEGIVDGMPGEAAFAQPSGIDVEGGSVWVADAEASAIRQISLTGEVAVRTHIGRGLFIFGDREGTARETRLQHPLDVIAAANRILICDTFNHRIRMYDPEGDSVITIAGSGLPGRSDGILMNVELNEPEAIALDGARFVIADTGNHRVVLADMNSLDAVTLLISD